MCRSRLHFVFFPFQERISFSQSNPDEGDNVEILIGMAKIGKYAVTGHGDGVEITVRPSGGITAILADGHGGSRAVSGISSTAALKAAQFVADGVREGMIARAVYDYFSTVQNAGFTLALTQISADTDAGKLLVCRNTGCPVMVRHEFGVEVYDEPVQPIGSNKNVKPWMTQIPLEEGLIAATFSDGVLNAGRKKGRIFDLKATIRMLEESRPADVQYIAESILERAMLLDSYQAMDHMSVVVMGIDGKMMDNPVECRTVRYPA